MDKIAIISDVHGNLPALETVFADIKQRGIETIYNLGDLAGKGPYPAEVVDLCREVCEITVRGNWDSVMHDTVQYTGEALTYYRGKLGEDRIAYLRSLPNSYDFVMSGKHIRLYHASHIHEFHRIFSFEEYDVYKEMFTNTDFTGTDKPLPDVVGYGDIHVAFVNNLHFDHKILFNVGSVGNPLDIPQASYTILTGKRDSTSQAPFHVELVRLPYDIEAVIQAARAREMPNLNEWEIEIRTAVHRSRQAKD